MKTYGDEGWISLLQDRMERARNRKIQNGSVFVGDEALGFAEREIIKDRLWMWLPEQFQKMPARMAKHAGKPGAQPSGTFSCPGSELGAATVHSHNVAAGYLAILSILELPPPECT